MDIPILKLSGGRGWPAIALFGLNLIAAALAVPAEPARVEVVLSQDGAVYRELYDALQGRLRAVAGDGIEVRARVMPVGESAATLLVGAGIPASQEVIDRHPETPVVATLLPRQAAADALARRGQQRPAPATALYLDQPLDRYIGLIRLVLPAATRLGVVYGPTSRADRAEAQDAARRAGLEFHAAEASADDNIVQVLEPLLAKTDVLLVLPDPEVSSPRNVYPLLMATYRKGIPVIGFSAAYVKAGALAAIYSSPEQMGQQVADVLANFLRRGQRNWPPPQSPRDFRVGVNRHVARSLGLTIPADEALYRQLRAWEVRP